MNEKKAKKLRRIAAAGLVVTKQTRYRISKYEKDIEVVGKDGNKKVVKDTRLSIKCAGARGMYKQLKKKEK